MGHAAAAASQAGRPPLVGPFGRRAIRVGRIFDIEVGVDVSWLFIFALVTFALATQFGAQHEAWSTIESWGAGLVASLIFFTTILLHELGHSVTSNLLGLPVRSITLFIFGGLARLSGNPERPRDEFLIGVAGPVVSVVLGLMFLALAAIVPDQPRAAEMAGAIFAWLGFVNLVLAAFNLFPGHPLDGGHLLRAFVWAASGNQRLATSIASAMGTAFAFVLMLGGAFSVLMGAVGGLWLVLIGWFLMRASRGTALQATLEDRLSRVSAGDAMADHCPKISGEETIEHLVADAVLHRGERHFCVEQKGELTGLVTLNEIKRVPPAERATTRAAEIMVPRERLVTIASDETLWDALRRMEESTVNQIPVTFEGALVGVLTREQLLRVIANQMAMGEPD